MKNKYKRIKTFKVDKEEDGSTVINEITAVVPDNGFEIKEEIKSNDKYRIGKKSENNVFQTLYGLREFGKRNNISIENLVVTKIDELGNEKRLPYIEFAYNNRYFDISKKDGFYYKWEWEKKDAFSQNELRYHPIRQTWLDSLPVDGIVSKKKKTWWDKIKDFFTKKQKRK